ncbi:hypothetical protein L218DRAFT_950294 [Marasmius fiardii PR-910]|nr:hypothetical protein L218DRAFT_950294 [Marasmius fiardii PR-910]
MGMFYIDLLRSSLGCAANELWMDPAKGRFCRGPTGPECFENYLDHDDIAIPSDVEFLNDDILIRYFSEKQDDLWFVDALSHAGHCEKLEDSPASNHPQVISSTTNSSIAFNNQNVWWWSGGCIANGELLPDGTIRFYLRQDRRGLRAISLPERYTWLSQASSVFHAYNVPSDKDLSTYRLIAPVLRLKGTIQKSKCKQKRRQGAHAPICLFFKLSSPFSPSVPFHTWSFDPTGQNPLSPDLCKHFGLHNKLALEVVHYVISWPTKVYVAARDYQIRKGFNPETTDFAQHLGSTIYELVPPGFNRFQEGMPDSERTIDIQTAVKTQLSISYSPFSHSQLFYDVSGFTKMNTSTSCMKTGPAGNVFGPLQALQGFRNLLFVTPLTALLSRAVSEDRESGLSTLFDTD